MNGGARDRRALAAMDTAGVPAAGGDATDYDSRVSDGFGISVLFDKKTGPAGAQQVY